MHHSKLGDVRMELDQLRSLDFLVDKNLVGKFVPCLDAAEPVCLVTYYMVPDETILSLLVACTVRVTLPWLLLATSYMTLTYSRVVSTVPS